MTTVPLERRQELVAMPVTLNGERAVVGGYRLPFAKVTQLRTGLSCEFAWETVERIITIKEGRFQS